MAAKSVLIVHDDTAFVDRFKSVMQSAAPDISVKNADSAPTAQSSIAQQAPDVLIVEAELLGGDGYAFTRQVKENPATQAVPVVILSLEANEISALKARQVGAAAQLASTLPVEAIVSKVVGLARTAQIPMNVGSAQGGAVSPGAGSARPKASTLAAALAIRASSTAR